MKFSPVIPTLRYKNADQAIHFLVDGLGFVQHSRYDGPNGTVMHAELSRGSGMIMLGTDSGDGKAADGMDMALGHASIYVIVDEDSEVDRVYNAALRLGGQSVRAPKNQDYGGRGATVRDHEGHYWSIGSYEPK